MDIVRKPGKVKSRICWIIWEGRASVDLIETAGISLASTEGHAPWKREYPVRCTHARPYRS